MRERPARASTVWLAASAACVATFGAVSARAQPAPVPLVVQRADTASECSDAVALADRVTLLTGRKALVASEQGASGFAYEVQILKSADGFTAIVLAGGKSRQISDPGPSCASLSDALALTLAILVDADEPPPSEPAKLPPSAPSEPVRIFVPSLPEPLRRADPRLVITPSAGLSTGLVGPLAPSLTLAADVRVAGPFSVLAGFTWMPPQDFPLGAGNVEVQLMRGQVAGCVGAWGLAGGARLAGCLQLDVGGLRGKSVGYTDTREVIRPWTAFGLTALLDVPLVGPLSWSARASVLVNVPQEAFAIDGVGEAFDPSVVGFLVGTGPSVTIF